MPSAAQFPHRPSRAEQAFDSNSSERDENFRLNDVDLFDQIRAARLHFERRGRPVAEVAGRCIGPAFQNIGNVNFLAAEAHCLYDSREQLAGASDKWFALFILVDTGCFANEHQLRVRVSYAEDRLRP